MINSLLASNVATYIILGVLVVAIIVMFVLSSRRRKKQEQDAKDLVDAVKPGNKVKTIGGICGIVVEVDNDENTFVLETGTEQSGKCFIKFDKQAIYQTDAVVKTEAKTEEPAAELPAEPVKADEVFEEGKAEPAPAVEEKAEEVKAEEPAKESESAAKTEPAAKTESAAKTKSTAKATAKKPAAKKDKE